MSSAWSIKKALDGIDINAYEENIVSNIDSFTNFERLGFNCVAAFCKRSKNKRKVQEQEFEQENEEDLCATSCRG
jgi:hypothetical protein